MPGRIFFRKEDKSMDEDRNIQEIVESRGFDFEEHKVVTKDGYILNIHRVINPKTFKDGDADKRRPVLLQHGFTGCSIHWLIAAGDGHIDDQEYDDEGNRCVSSNLGFALAKYRDVWMGNFRGNRYSLEHKTLTTKDKEFWDFSLDEFIDDDLPSTIKYILAMTKHETLAYVGHSQGTLTMFGLLASKPEYNDVIKPFIALAPIVRLNHISTPLKFIFPYIYPITSRITGQAGSTTFIKPLLSGHMFDTIAQRISHTILFLMGGFHWSQVDVHRLRVYHSHPFGDVSFKNINHFLQMYIHGQFCKFNYDEVINHINHINQRLHINSLASSIRVGTGHGAGDNGSGIVETKSRNQFLYNSTHPPIYDIKKITNKYVCLFHGANDWFTSEEDLNFIRSELKVKIMIDKRVDHDDWNHLDFIFGKDCGHFVNSHVIDIIKDVK